MHCCYLPLVIWLCSTYTYFTQDPVSNQLNNIIFILGCIFVWLYLDIWFNVLCNKLNKIKMVETFVYFICIINYNILYFCATYFIVIRLCVEKISLSLFINRFEYLRCTLEYLTSLLMLRVKVKCEEIYVIDR